MELLREGEGNPPRPDDSLVRAVPSLFVSAYDLEYRTIKALKSSPPDISHSLGHSILFMTSAVVHRQRFSLKLKACHTYSIT